MGDLISRKALLEELDKWINPCVNYDKSEFLSGIATAISEVETAPTIDPVHAAGACYCRECTCWNRHDDILPDGRFPDWGYCSKMLDSDSEVEITTLENDFCSNGQRREDTK